MQTATLECLPESWFSCACVNRLFSGRERFRARYSVPCTRFEYRLKRVLREYWLGLQEADIARDKYELGTCVTNDDKINIQSK